jgi:hypothetical protein
MDVLNFEKDLFSNNSCTKEQKPKVVAELEFLIENILAIDFVHKNIFVL